MATTILGAIEAAMESDGTLAAILTGGVHQVSGRAAPIDPTNTPTAYAKSAATKYVPVLQPCASLLILSEVPGPTRLHKSAQVQISFYDSAGYVNTGAALERTRTVLDGSDGHGTRLVLDDGSSLHVWLIDHPVRGSTEEDIITAGDQRGASYEAARYMVETVFR